MSDSSDSKQQEKTTKARVKPSRDSVKRKQLTMVQRGAVVNNQIEEQGKGDVLGERTAVFPVSADKVFRTPAATESRFASDLSRVPTHTVALQSKHVIQTNLTVNAPGDSYEQEADQVADAVMRMTTPSSSNLTDDKRGLSDGSPTISRIQASGGGVGAISPDVEKRVERMKGSGHILPDTERSFFEDRMGYDFSNVRIHTDANAVQTSRDLNARAFTIGTNVAFNAGAYQPGTDVGRRLLAHELTHVVQQTGSALSRPIEGKTGPRSLLLMGEMGTDSAIWRKPTRRDLTSGTR